MFGWRITNKIITYLCFQSSILIKDKMSNIFYMYLTWTPIDHKYVFNILTAVILKEKNLFCGAVFSCTCWQNLGNIRVEGHNLGKNFPGMFSTVMPYHQLCTRHSPARKSKSFFICEHLWSWYVFPAVHVYPAFASTCWPCMEPSGRWCHLLMKGVGIALPGTMWSLLVEGKGFSSSASIYKALVTAVLSSLRVGMLLKWWCW